MEGKCMTEADPEETWTRADGSQREAKVGELQPPAPPYHDESLIQVFAALTESGGRSLGSPGASALTLGIIQDRFARDRESRAEIVNLRELLTKADREAASERNRADVLEERLQKLDGVTRNSKFLLSMAGIAFSISIGAMSINVPLGIGLAVFGIGLGVIGFKPELLAGRGKK
jgi:hypothetical protein